MAKHIMGQKIANEVYEELAIELRGWKEQGIVPGLAVVLVGNNPASKAYVGAKDRKCHELGYHSLKIEFPKETSQDRLLREIEELNGNPAIHGILVQMPLPDHMDVGTVIQAIAPEKDVDGLHPINLGKLCMEDSTGFAPCTPLGCQRLLRSGGVATEGKHIVVLGRSLLVGKSFALLALMKGPDGNATVTIVHSRTKNLASHCRAADILVAAIGKPEFVEADWVREGAVVIDVGINRVEDPESAKGYRLVGDVAFAQVEPKCSAITPVPGGVGPMTIAMLMSNTMKAMRMAQGAAR